MLSTESAPVNLKRSVEHARELALANVQYYNGQPSLAPHADLFPDPFLWDTALEGIGLRHTDPELAAAIIETQTQGQWSNGQFPNQLFFRNARMERILLNSRRSIYAPDRLPTSGITQPPLLAEATWQVGEKLDEHEQEHFYKRMLPKLTNSHEYLLDEQMINPGLIALKHPYESGMDNTPPWLETVRDFWDIYRQTKSGERMASFARRGLLFRRDTKNTPADHRMEDEDVVAYGILMIKIRQHRYDMASIARDPSIPMLEDVGFNAIFAKANKRLGNIAEAVGERLNAQLIDKIEEHNEGIDQLWSETDNTYYSRNARTKELIPLETIGSIMMLYSGVVRTERAERLIKSLGDDTKFNTPSGPPSSPLDSPYFDAKRYWQGGNWPMSTYCVVEGLEEYGEMDMASQIRQKNLVLDHNEYTNALTGEPLGAAPFMPRVALHIEFAHKEDPDLAA